MVSNNIINNTYVCVHKKYKLTQSHWIVIAFLMLLKTRVDLACEGDYSSLLVDECVGKAVARGRQISEKKWCGVSTHHRGATSSQFLWA